LKKDTEISEFDRLIQKSLDGAKMPAPNGVWEGISASTSIAGAGSSIGLMAKIGGLKTIIISASVVLVAAVTTVIVLNQSDENTSQTQDNTTIAEQSGSTENENADSDIIYSENTGSDVESNISAPQNQPRPSGPSQNIAIQDKAINTHNGDDQSGISTKQDAVQNDKKGASDTEIAPLDFNLSASEICRNENCEGVVRRNDDQIDFYWVVDGAKMYNKSSVNFKATEAGTFNITLVSFPGGQKQSVTKSIFVHESKAKVESFKIQKGLYSFKTLSEFKSYKWQFGSEDITSAEATPKQYFDYQVDAGCKIILWTVSNKGCKDSVHTGVSFVEAPIIANVFTPYKKEGMNDNFIIPIEHEFYYHLTIFNNHGDRVFESNSKNNTWDGTDMNTGMMAPIGGYTYKFVYQQIGESRTTRQGTVMLVK
jgi:hypothetical protein